MVLLPTHTAAAAAAAPAEDPQRRRRRSPFLAGLAGLCLGAAAYSYATGHSGHSASEEQTRRLEVRGEGQDVPEYDLPPADHGAVVEAEVDIPGPNSAEPAIGDQVSLIALQ